MKISAHCQGLCIVVPCGDGSEDIKWLIEETVKRASNLSDKIDATPDTLEARLECSHGVLMKDDKIKDVLDDNAVIFLGSTLGTTSFPGQHDPTTMHDLGHSNSRPYNKPKNKLKVDGNNMTPLELIACGKGELAIELTDESRKKVQVARDLIEKIVDSKEVVYGVNTGFGKFARVVIPHNKLKELQINLIRSHAICVGEPLTIERSRSMLALRINILAKGYSGIAVENLDKMIAIFNAGCVSFVPSKGTVGASGDLGPLAHLALGMIGEGKMWSPNTGWGEAAVVLNVNGLKPIELGPKEGLAMINGTQMITALGCEALERASAICRQADIVAAMSLEVLKGTTKAFNPEIHKTRPHKGQQLVASRLRSLLHSEVYPSNIAESHRFCDRVQDAYTIRCTPQVHGIAFDTIEFVRGLISTEVNSATDNPMVFGELGETMSGGNFHGEYPAKALDYLAIGVHELANMSERRIERLINPTYSGLPAFLTRDGGLNSGFMIPQCTAAALVSENKVLTHPSSVDSLSTSAGTEDHVSMGGFSARKAITVVEHVEYVLAIELLAACQGLEFLRPLQSTAPLEAVHRLVRTVSKPYDTDRYLKNELEAVWDLLRQEKLWKTVQPYVQNYEENFGKEAFSDAAYVQPPSPSGYSTGYSTPRARASPEMSPPRSSPCPKRKKE